MVFRWERNGPAGSICINGRGSSSISNTVWKAWRRCGRSCRRRQSTDGLLGWRRRAGGPRSQRAHYRALFSAEVVERPRTGVAHSKPQCAAGHLRSGGGFVAHLAADHAQTRNWFLSWTTIATRVLRRRHVLTTLPARQVPTTMVLTLHDDSVGTLPLLTTSALHELVGDMRKCGINGFCTRQWLISDHDASAAYLGKAAWNPHVTPDEVYTEQIRATCGDAAVPAMLRAFHDIESVTTRLEDHGMGLTFPHAGMMMRQWDPAPLAQPLVEDQAIYRRALEAVRSVPTPSRSEGKAYVKYWEARLQFAVRYFDAIQIVKQAAAAEQAAREAHENMTRLPIRLNWPRRCSMRPRPCCGV